MNLLICILTIHTGKTRALLNHKKYKVDCFGYQGFLKQLTASEISMFYVKINGNLETFLYINFNSHFLENKNLFQKLEYIFLVKTIKIENASFQFKTALSESNVKRNIMATTKWTYHKELNFASNCFRFLENLYQFYNLLERVNLMYQRPKSPYLYFL